MQVIPTDIPAVKLILPPRHRDHRGFFSEVFKADAMFDAGIDAVFTQDNHSLSVERGVLRGLHYQIQPMEQAKLIRVVRGSIFDVALDIRRDSPTFGKHVSAVLSADNWKQIFIPPGFAHGFLTLEPNTEVFYKVSHGYSPTHERGIRWNDPALGIDWNIDEAHAILSGRDREHVALADAPTADLF